MEKRNAFPPCSYTGIGTICNTFEFVRNLPIPMLETNPVSEIRMILN